MDKGGLGWALSESSVERGHQELTAEKENGKRWICGGRTLRPWEPRAQCAYEDTTTRYADISLSALRTQPVKKQLSAEGR